MIVHHIARFINARAHRHSDQALARRHNGRHRLVEAFFKTQIAVGYQAHHFAVFHHRQARHFALAPRLHFHQFANQHIGADGNRVFHNAAFMALHLGHGIGLALGGHVFMDNADAAFLRHRNGQLGFGNGIHRGRK